MVYEPASIELVIGHESEVLCELLYFVIHIQQ